MKGTRMLTVRNRNVPSRAIPRILLLRFCIQRVTNPIMISTIPMSKTMTATTGREKNLLLTTGTIRIIRPDTLIRKSAVFTRIPELMNMVTAAIAINRTARIVPVSADIFVTY